jgi:DNA polymerase elongation subunit (family B)
MLTIIGYGFLDEYMNNDIKFALAKNNKLKINLICRDEDEEKYKSKLMSLHMDINSRIKVKILENICDVTTNELSDF